MTCLEFQRWLDEGRPAAAAALTHASTCAACAQSLHAADEVERLLAVVVPARIGAGFNDAVMQRIHAEPRLAAVLVQLMAEPAVPLSLALAMAVPAIQPQLAIAVAPLLGWLSWRLFRTYERLATPSV